MLIQNAVKIIEDGKITYLISVHRHHFNQYTFKDNDFYFVDGGVDYCRRGYKFEGKGDKTIVEWSLDDDFSIKDIRNRLLWGTYRKSGGKELTYKLIQDLELSHLRAIIEENNKSDNDSSKVVYNLSQIHLKVIKYWIKEKEKYSKFLEVKIPENKD